MLKLANEHRLIPNRDRNTLFIKLKRFWTMKRYKLKALVYKAALNTDEQIDPRSRQSRQSHVSSSGDIHFYSELNSVAQGQDKQQFSKKKSCEMRAFVRIFFACLAPEPVAKILETSDLWFSRLPRELCKESHLSLKCHELVMWS